MERGPSPKIFQQTHAHTQHTHMRIYNSEMSYTKTTRVISETIIRPKIILNGLCPNRGKSVRSWCDGSSDRSFIVDPLSYFSFQPVLHDWCNKCSGMCYPLCRMMHIKEPLLLIGNSSPCGGSGFHLSLSEWSFTMCL